jgi:hypothetical protein
LWEFAPRRIPVSGSGIRDADELGMPTVGSDVTSNISPASTSGGWIMIGGGTGLSAIVAASQKPTTAAWPSAASSAMAA